MQQADIVVVGGGASGMMAAITAARAFRQQHHDGRVVLLEKESRIGKKLLATGNGRCNLSNLAVAPERYHDGGDWIREVLHRYSAKNVIRTFEKMGLLCRSDREGRVYPYNLQSSAVLEILRMQLALYEAEVFCDQSITAIEGKKGRFRISTADGTVWQTERVILAAGGKAAPKLGADGSGTRLAKQLGHEIQPEFPALAPLKTDPTLVRSLKGMRSQGSVTLLADGKAVQTEQGEVQFTDYGLSGICVFQLSGQAANFLQQGKQVELSLDLMTDWKEQQLTKQIAGQGKRYKDLPTQELLCGFINQRVGQAVVKQALGNTAPQTAGDCTFEQYGVIAHAVKDFRFPVLGTVGWESAQITGGGVICKEVNPITMESKRCSGLYLTGELLEVYGDCGGFNLHLAWSSGIAAGEACAESLRKEEQK